MNEFERHFSEKNYRDFLKREADRAFQNVEDDIRRTHRSLVARKQIRAVSDLDILSDEEQDRYWITRFVAPGRFGTLARQFLSRDIAARRQAIRQAHETPVSGADILADDVIYDILNNGGAGGPAERAGRQASLVRHNRAMATRP